jgi:hypothetical protein
MGWSDRVKTGDKIFGTILANILNNCNQMLWVCRILQPLNTLKNISVLLPPNAEYEIGFMHLFFKIAGLNSLIGDGITFYCSEETGKNLVRIAGKTRPGMQINTINFNDWTHFTGVTERIDTDHLLLVISARRGTLSYQNPLNDLPEKLPEIFDDRSLILIFPEQSLKVTGALNLEGMDMLDVQDNINLIGKLGKLLKNIFSR